jgi:hypothetical protein
MLKKPKGKDKRGIVLICLISFLILASVAAYVLNPYINISLALNLFPFLSPSAKSTPTPFYGETIDMSQILPTSHHYIVNSKGQDLIDIAANLGVNLIRITNITRSFNNNADAIYTRDQWNQVLNKMQSKGIKALILIETASNNRDYYTPEIQPVYLHLVQEYIDSEVFSHPDVYAVDIKNEPLLTDANLRMLQAAHMMIKKKYPALKQTIGWWATPQSSEDPYNRNKYNWGDYSAGQKLNNIVDFYSLHMYGFDTPPKWGIHLDPDLRTKVFISASENGLQTKKSILIEEFGAANGDAISDQDSLGSPQLQANVYQGVYQALKEMHSSQIIGSVAFLFYSRNHYPDAWAIVKNNGDYLFPATYILQEYALGKNNPSLQAATVVTSQSYVVKNASNHTIKNLAISDRIGLKIQLDTSKTYSLFLSMDNILEPIELFHYEPGSKSYYAVYQAVKKGSVQLSIIPNANCKSSNPLCTTPIYTLTINVR